MDNAYRLVLQCDLPYYADDGSGKIVRTEHLDIEFDYVEDTSVNESADITTHPLVNGDSIADHKYETPTSMTVSGSFSLQGNKPYPFYGESNDRLTNIEALFSRLKKEGIFCRLVKMAKSDNATVRFMARDNMVLTNIAWTERQNSLGFNFTFNQVLVATVQQVDYETDTTDENLPALTDPQTLDFTDTLLDMREVDMIVQKVFYDSGMIDNDFIIMAQSIALGLVTAGGVLAVGAVALTSMFATAISFGLAIPGAGWAIAIFGATAAGIAALVTSIVKGKERQAAQEKFKLEAFKVYEDERKNQAEVERYCNYLGTIHQNLESLEEHMKVYGIPTNENQECAVNIDGDYYVFKFVKNNVSNKWTLKVDSITDQKTVAEMSELVGYNDLSELTKDNYLFRVPGNGYYCYIMNFKVGQAISRGASTGEIRSINDDLTSYCILITGVNMSEFKNLLEDVVLEAMTR